MIEKNCKEFVDVLASKEPVPGGGGAAALVGALGSALCEMAVNLTTGKKKYAAYEDDFSRIISECKKHEEKLLNLVEADAASFLPLQQAYSVPKDAPGRKELLEKVSIEACGPAAEMMREIAKTIELLEEASQKCSVMMISDVGCGAALAGAALRSASYNIFVNTKSLESEAALQLEKEADAILDEYLPRAQRVAEEVYVRVHR